MTMPWRWFLKAAAWVAGGLLLWGLFLVGSWVWFVVAFATPKIIRMQEVRSGDAQILLEKVAGGATSSFGFRAVVKRPGQADCIAWQADKMDGKPVGLSIEVKDGVLKVAVPARNREHRRQPCGFRSIEISPPQEKSGH